MDLSFDLTSAFGIDPDALDFDLTGFVPASKETYGVESERHLLPRVYQGTVNGPVLYEHTLDLVDGFVLEPGMRMFCLVSGNFVFGDVLEALAERGIAVYRTMTIQTLSMSQENIDSLRSVIERCFEMESLRIVLSDYFYAHERKATGLVPYLYERLDVDDILDVAFASVHTKIVTFETVEGLKAPASDGGYSWTSSAYREQMTGLFCSQDDSKEFEYSDGRISFDFSMQGETARIVMRQASQEKGLLSGARGQHEALSDTQDLVLNDYGYVLSSGYVKYAIEVTNPNKAAAPRATHVSVVGRRADGSIRFSDDWTIGSTAPGATTYWASQAGDGDVEESDTIEISVSVDGDDWVASSSSGDYYLIENASTGPSGGYSTGLKTTGEITLKEDAAVEGYGSVKTPMIVCVLKDAEGKIITGYSTFTYGGDLAVGEPKAFELESMFDAVDYATAEVYANPW